MECIVMSSINFDNVYLLLIAIPLIVLFTVPFFIAVRKDNRNGHNVASQIMHVLMAIIIAFAAAGTSMTTVLTETQVYVVADVSYSANKNLGKLDQYIKQLNLPANSKVGLVCFGKDYRLVSELGKQKDLASVTNSGVDDSETNIAEALNYTGTLFDNDVIKRIVLITDGRQTDQVDTNAVRRAVDSLESLRVKVDAIFLNDNIDENTHEIQISNADYTRSAFINSDEKVNLTIQSTFATEAILTLYRKENENFVSVDQTTVTLEQGRNIKSFTLPTNKGGTFDYQVVVEQPNGDDASGYNNTYSFTQTVSTDVRLLIVSGNWESMKKLVARYENRAKIDVYENTGENIMNKFEFRAKYDADISNPFAEDPNPDITINIAQTPFMNLPATVNELCLYDEIIIDGANLSEQNDRGSNKWQNATEFLKSLDLVVKAGKSLVTLGDVHIADATPETQVDADGNGHEVNPLLALDNMLPIKFGRDDSMPKLFTIVMDVSTSMREKNRFEHAKQAAILFLNKLNEGDAFSIVAFNGLVETLVPRTSVEYGRESAKRILNNLEMGTGTMIGRGLEAAYDDAKNLTSYSDKQFVLITDGVGGMSVNADGYEDSPEGLAKFVEDMYKNDRIATSVMDAGKRGSSNDDGDTIDLKELSQKGGGGYADISGDRYEDQIDDNLIADLSKVTLEYTVTDGINNVNVVNKNDEVVKGFGITANNMPKVAGFAVGYSKPSAVTVMEVDYKKGNAQKQSPLYSYWKYGNGLVASFTSSLTGAWSQEWSDTVLSSENTGTDNANKVSYSVMDTFLNNLFKAVTPKERTDYPFTVDINQSESSTAIQVALAERPADASAVEMKIQVAMPDGEVVDRYLTDSGYYFNYEFLTSEVGRYDITITYNFKEISYSSNFNLNVSYSSEYNEFASFEASALFKALNGRGQVSVDGALTVENDPSEVGVYQVDFTLPLLIIAVVMYIADIVVRKLKWEDVVSFFGGFKKPDKNKKSGGGKE